MSYPPDTRTLIDDLLAEQSRLTAVDRFARRHSSGDLPAQARYYRSLLPATPPAPGEQYAFAVDLDMCTGCKACVSACHSLNGLDDGETWRDIGLLVGGTATAPYQQTVTTACHHCVEPACADGCPVLAYEKDETTGIVRHLDDQCIGCQYCMLKCPYEVPKYSHERGIVRKCDMCHSRLSVGEAPACVQACPSAAISIRVVSKESVREFSTPETTLLPGTFPSEYTKPTTSYSTRRTIPSNAVPADAATFRLSQAHWPLIGMLLLTQLAAGMYLSLAVLTFSQSATGASIGAVANVAFLTLQVGLGISVLHLGRPLGAWRAFLGLRRSWMSREIVAFGLFAGLAAGLSALSLAGLVSTRSPRLAPYLLALEEPWLTQLVAIATAASAVLGLFCSVMIYVDTRRPFWAAPLTGIKFFGTSLLLGSAAVGVVFSWMQASDPALPLTSMVTGFAIAATAIRTLLFGWESANFCEGLHEDSPIHRSTLTVWKLHKPLLIIRALLFVASTGFGIGTVVLHGKSAALAATAAFVLTFISQTIERYFFFTAVDAPRMPGGVAP